MFACDTSRPTDVTSQVHATPLMKCHRPRQNSVPTSPVCRSRCKGIQDKVPTSLDLSNFFGVLTESGVHLHSVPYSSAQNDSSKEHLNTLEPRMTPPSPSTRPRSWQNCRPTALNFENLSRSQSSTPYSESTAASQRRREAFAARAAARSQSKLSACKFCGVTSSCAQQTCEICGERIDCNPKCYQGLQSDVSYRDTHQR